MRSSLFVGFCIAAVAIGSGAAPAATTNGDERAPMETAAVAALPEMSDHWVWVPDRLIQHSMLYDGDTGEVLGMVDSPSLLTPKTPLVVRSRGEIYTADITHSRGMRGDRLDFISIYDLETLDYKAEIVIPTMVGSSNASLNYAELIGDRFMAVFNQFPLVSVSIVDLERRSFVEEIPIGGCAGIFPVDAVRFASLCGDGTTLLVSLDEDGRKSGFEQSERFFDAVEDPVVMSAGRNGMRWTFVTFAGDVHTVDYSGGAAGGKPRVEERWSLLRASDRDAKWRPGGLQQVALHRATNRLYVVMHQGDPGSHKAPGPEIWVYDIGAQQRVARIEAPNLTASFLASFMGVSPQSFTYRLLDWTLPSEGVHAIAVSQDASPLLFVRHATLGSVGVIDAMTGETLRFLTETGLAGPTLRVP